MIDSLVTLGWLLWSAWWLLVLSICWTLYRTVRLPALWWIGLYYAVGIITVPLMQYYGYRIAHSGLAPQLTLSGQLPADFAHSPLALASTVATTLDYGGDLLVIVLAFAEAAVLVARVYPEARSRLLQALTLLHAHTRAVGIVAIITTALLPVPAMIYFYTHT